MLATLKAALTQRADVNTQHPAPPTHTPYPPNKPATKLGQVYLIGAGPGDPELLTRKAWRLLQEADVVVHDALVSDALLTEIPTHIHRLYVGKRKGQHSLSQIEICQMLIALAQAGKRVVRLKGGDPLVFGRLQEELDALQAANIPFTIVPGITAAAGCAASCGFPLTERQLAPRLRLITAHSCENREPDWASLAQRDETLVFYMGVSSATRISEQLQHYGLPANWPALVVENGTLPQQRNHPTTLGQLATTIRRHQISTPALIYIGQVVRQQTAATNQNSAENTALNIRSN